MFLILLKSMGVPSIKLVELDRVKRYMYGYLEGLQAGTELDLKATEFKKTYRSHRRVGIHS